MAFDRTRRERQTADHPAMRPGDPSSFLSQLDAAVVAYGGMSCGIVPRDDVAVLFVINAESPRRCTEIGCEHGESEWWFTWAKTGDTIGPADDAEGTARAIAKYLGVHLRTVRP